MISEIPYLKNIINKFIKYFYFYERNIIIKHVLDHLSTSQVADRLDFLFGTKYSNKFLHLFSCYHYHL